MPYPRNLLNDNEKIVIDRHPHWSFLLQPAVMISFAVIATIVIGVVNVAYAWIGLVCFCLALIGSLGHYLRWRTTNFVVTTDRIIVRTGVLSKSGMEIPLDRVMNISYHQALWERMLGTGDLMIESAGESGRQHFTDVADPSEVQSLIYKHIELAEHDGLGGNTSPGMSIPEQLEKLDELRQKGVVTEAEFLDKKQDLLDRM